MSKTVIAVVSGDITGVRADALIATINSDGEWYGESDRTIERVAGGLFHEQATDAMPFRDGETVIARSNGRVHGGAFENVVFVVDDRIGPLRKIICAGLRAARNAGFASVSLPTIRTGVTLGWVEKDADETVAEMALGIQEFLAESSCALQSITFVVPDDEPEIRALLHEALTE